MQGSERAAWIAGLVWSVACGAGCSSGSTSGGGVLATVGTIGSDASIVAPPGVSAPAAFGEPCIPMLELDATFQGFSVEDVSVESKAPACSSSICLVNHFQGRTTCAFGQSAPGTGPTGANGSPAASLSSEDGCVIPGQHAGAGASSQVTATNVSVAGFPVGTVPPQIAGTGAGDRTASKAVYCSCRCANSEGLTNDGATYCACPSNYSCTQLVTSIGDTDQDISGAYCVLEGTEYNPSAATADTCNAQASDATEPGYCASEY